MLEFARWKYILVAVVGLLALVFAAPNFFGEDLAVQVARKDRAPIDEPVRQSIEAALVEIGGAIPALDWNNFKVDADLAFLAQHFCQFADGHPVSHGRGVVGDE